MPRLEPLAFRPVLKPYTWGGRNLERLGRSLPPGRVAESWEISDHPSGATPVRSGPSAGRSLADLRGELGLDLVGDRNADALDRGRFPLLIKILDANEWLSVQVHPDDRYARRHHGEPGKTEMWVVLRAEPGAELIYGLRRAADAGEVAAAIAADRLEPLLRRLPARDGDVFFVPPGTVHALGPGLVLAEIQQASDLTFRLFDWNRAAADRPLHLDEGLAVADLSGGPGGPVVPRLLHPEPVRVEELARCSHFVTERLTLPAGGSWKGRCSGATFEIWGVLEGRVALSGEWGETALPAVDWRLLPAALGSFAVRAAEPSVLLRIRTPGPHGEAPS